MSAIGEGKDGRAAPETESGSNHGILKILPETGSFASDPLGSPVTSSSPCGGNGLFTRVGRLGTLVAVGTLFAGAFDSGCEGFLGASVPDGAGEAPGVGRSFGGGISA